MAYTAQDIPLAIRFFLMVVEMTGDDNDDTRPPPPPTGITVRAWYGVELVSSFTPRAPRCRSGLTNLGLSSSRLDASKQTPLWALPLRQKHPLPSTCRNCGSWREMR